MSWRALVLGGRREEGDPLAAATGAPHRALLDIEGEPMLARVVRTLEESPRIGEIHVSIDAPELLDDVPALAERRENGSLRVHRSESSPSRSVLAVVDGAGPGNDWLLTTADHALLDSAMIDHFTDESRRLHAERGVAVALGLVEQSVIEARFPETRRTYWPFRGEAFSGANLFAAMGPSARPAIEFWIRAESYRKRPWRLVSEFGLGALLLFALRLRDLDAAFDRISGPIGAKVGAVRMPVAEAAVDVDRPDDLELVLRVLAERRATAG